MLKIIFHGLFLCGGLICCMAIGPLILRMHVSHLEAANRIEGLQDEQINDTRILEYRP